MSGDRPLLILVSDIHLTDQLQGGLVRSRRPSSASGSASRARAGSGPRSSRSWGTSSTSCDPALVRGSAPPLPRAEPRHGRGYRRHRAADDRARGGLLRRDPIEGRGGRARDPVRAGQPRPPARTRPEGAPHGVGGAHRRGSRRRAPDRARVSGPRRARLPRQHR